VAFSPFRTSNLLAPDSRVKLVGPADVITMNVVSGRYVSKRVALNAGPKGVWSTS
jgi:hypothetical protein